MPKTRDDGGQVYPTQAEFDPQRGMWLRDHVEGMTVRQLYKAMAVAGMLAAGEATKRSAGELAKLSAQVADAMIKEDR